MQHLPICLPFSRGVAWGGGRVVTPLERRLLRKYLSSIICFSCFCSCIVTHSFSINFFFYLILSSTPPLLSFPVLHLTLFLLLFFSLSLLFLLFLLLPFYLSLLPTLFLLLLLSLSLLLTLFLLLTSLSAPHVLLFCLCPHIVSSSAPQFLSSSAPPVSSAVSFWQVS